MFVGQQSMRCLTRTSHSRRVPGPSCCTPSVTTAADAAPPAGFAREKWLTDSDHTADPNIEPAVIANLARLQVDHQRRNRIRGAHRCPINVGGRHAQAAFARFHLGASVAGPTAASGSRLGSRWR